MEYIGSLRKDVFERHRSSRSGVFLGSGFAHIFEQIVSIREKTTPILLTCVAQKRLLL